ncbi:hypothetical protein LO762_12135 [Actinocorallia sp. API 0066]|uniref:hypothetical protein n=1 Tax=Actinocorallia sp. API 0066 TaxID=2896846 RepID=UPI001E3F222B|nr:hypothetical protein [Actinocorallia sp. API 0066]MCD0449933.1 hypothetical protein [Actinocorallia sp. API 0066]
MCVSMGPAAFSGTILYCGRRLHPEHGRIEVLGYQNTAVNLAAGPNALLLHLPARSIDARHFLPVSRAESVLQNMVDAVAPVAAGSTIDWMGGDAPRGAVQVFRHDIYTVVLAENAADITAALGRVEPSRRPALNPELFDFYAAAFPDHAVALCCFDNAEAAAAKPLLLWYRPLDDDRLVLPAIDCHTGAVPDLDAVVHTDHWVLFGSDETDPDWGTPVTYRDRLRSRLRAFLPDRVVGRRFQEPLPNGDFAITHTDLRQADLTRIHRLRP